MPESSERGALTEAVFYILLSLFEPTHGYGIIKFIKEISNERVVLGSGTLYGAINTLTKKDLIKVVKTTERKDYVITEKGKEAFFSEMERLRELISHGEMITGGERDDT